MIKKLLLSLTPRFIKKEIEQKERDWIAFKVASGADGLFKKLPAVKDALILLSESLKTVDYNFFDIEKTLYEKYTPLKPEPSPAPEPAQILCIIHRLQGQVFFFHKASDVFFTPDPDGGHLFSDQKSARTVQKILPFDKTEILPFQQARDEAIEALAKP